MSSDSERLERIFDDLLENEEEITELKYLETDVKPLGKSLVLKVFAKTAERNIRFTISARSCAGEIGQCTLKNIVVKDSKKNRENFKGIKEIPKKYFFHFRRIHFTRMSLNPPVEDVETRKGFLEDIYREFQNA